MAPGVFEFNPTLTGTFPSLRSRLDHTIIDLYLVNETIKATERENVQLRIDAAAYQSTVEKVKSLEDDLAAARGKIKSLEDGQIMTPSIGSRLAAIPGKLDARFRQLKDLLQEQPFALSKEQRDSYESRISGNKQKQEEVEQKLHTAEENLETNKRANKKLEARILELKKAAEMIGMYLQSLDIVRSQQHS